ncbi:MAG: 50S ribosomal protein L19 [SAR202 cluster bacterium]|mgnify:FL=1|nr:50S ribosomal protein L19 [Chloroflexota bacterium]MQG50449.1 50S ribosomal protein L19 [SAR202 cluster bacterium]|tara:strand:- start:6242 stop:6586 length:345 start_codon:yes stop_codon:yes gene_type:complete
MEPNQLVQAPNKENIDDFSPGDTIKVDVRIIEGNRERVQSLEGVVIGEKGSGLQRTFTLRRTTRGFGVELTFPIHSPKLESLKVLRRGDVRRAKLYYLRNRSGKSARIKEKRQY